MSEKLMELLINCLPSIIAAITCVITMFKVIGGLNAWKESNDDSNVAQLEKDLKNVVKKNFETYQKLEKVMQENEDLKQELKKVIMLVEADLKKVDEESQNESEG